MGKRLNELSEATSILGNEFIPIQNGEEELQKVAFNTIVTKHDERYYTKEEVDRLLANFVSKDVVEQMIQEALDNYNKPDEPITPEPTSEPTLPPTVTPTTNIGTITDDNSIVIDETQLENGVYTLKYIDSNNNIISNFNDITTFEINN